ncbi:MAG: hypothetical protein V3S82_01710 [Dehalococcoidia bacterium]
MVQEEGKVFYWVLPGPRRLSPVVFGTPDDPSKTAEDDMMALAGTPMGDILAKVPVLIGVPTSMRNVSADGKSFTDTKMMTLFSDKGMPTSGSIRLLYKDRQKRDRGGMDMGTDDGVELETVFTDPMGNIYEIQVKMVVAGPLRMIDPDEYKTGGGVIVDTFHHGRTDMGTPLFPRAYTWGAVWTVADIIVNGEIVNTNQFTHIMTTETVRDKNYKMAIDEELPLALDNTIAGQGHHTHIAVLPITMTATGMKFEPVHTAFILPNGQPQPFIHAMFEQDTIVKAPYRD